MEHLTHKIEHSIQLIRKAEPTALRYRAEGFYLAFSGGKDSQVLLRLTQMAGVAFTPQYNLTTLDAPENVRFIKEHYPMVEIVRPQRTFLQICRHHKMLRIRAEKFNDENPDVWGTFTDEEVFWFWAQKQGPKNAAASKLQTSIEFPL